MPRTADDRDQAFYLLKTEPSSYSWDDLERDGSTVWEGVRNYTAQKHLRDVRQGDLAFLYHTGKERQVVGIARIASDAYPDPNEETPELHVFDLEPVERFERPVPLAAIKDDPRFRDADLVRLPRLSVMPVEPELWQAIVALGGRDEPGED
jgi:predicted RNA-binding protein with PUA-like domain